MKGGERRRKEGGDQRFNNSNDASPSAADSGLKGRRIVNEGKHSSY